MRKAASSFLLISWLASFLLAPGALRADTVIPPLVLANQAGTSLTPLGSYTSLGCVTLGAATASVNLSATGGILFSITGNAQALVQWSTGTGPWGNALNLQGTGYMAKQGTLVRFLGNGNGYACISYQTMQSGGGSGGGTSSNVVVTSSALPTGAATEATLQALSLTANSAYSQDTTTLNVLKTLSGTSSTNGTTQANSYAYTTTTAAGTAGRGGSFTAVALTSTYAMNLTFMAGVNSPGICTLYPGNGPSASFYWNTTPGNWTVAPNTPIAVSTTPMMFTYGIGDFLNLSVTAAALSVTAQIGAKGIQ